MDSDRQVDDEVIALKQQMRQLIHHFSHDLRNPLVNMHALLNDMKSMLSEVEAGRQAVLKTEMPETVRLFEQTVNRMSQMINGTNDIYHCMFDELESESVNLQLLIERVLNRFEGRLSNIDVSLGLLPNIRADSLALARIVEQLIDNAVRSMGQAGGKLSIVVEAGDDSDRLVVSDTGCGISKDDLEQVFLPFFAANGDAPGMGLAIVKALAESHGGKVCCESEPGSGSSFHVTFPSSSAKAG